MISCMWRASGPDFDVDAFASRYGIDQSDVWHRGEAGRLGRVHKNSGFGTLVTDETDFQKHLDDIQECLGENREAMIELRDQEIRAMLDIGVTVGTEDQFAVALGFPPVLLQQIADLGLGLTVSAYPASDAVSDARIR